MTYKRLLVEWTLVLALMTLAFIRRKKIRLFPSLFLTLFVTFFSLLSPFGKVLTTVSSLKITEGALCSGLHKSAVLVGMVFLSQTIVNYKITLPGKVGTFLHQVFFFLEQFTAQQISFKKRHFIEQIDENLQKVWQNSMVQGGAPCS